MRSMATAILLVEGHHGEKASNDSAIVAEREEYHRQEEGCQG